MISLVSITELEPPFVLALVTTTTGGLADGGRRKKHRQPRPPIYSPALEQPKIPLPGRKLIESLRPVTYESKPLTVVRAFRSRSQSGFIAAPEPVVVAKPIPPKPKPLVFSGSFQPTRIAAFAGDATCCLNVTWAFGATAGVDAFTSDSDCRCLPAGMRKRYRDRFKLARELDEEMIISGTF